MKKTLYFSNQKVIDKLESLSKKNEMSGYVSDLILNDIEPKSVITREEVVSLIVSYLGPQKPNMSQNNTSVDDCINSVLGIYE